MKAKNTVLNTVILLIGCFIAFKIYTSQVAVITSLREKKESEIKKNEALQGIGRTKKQLTEYVKFVNNKDIDSILHTIGKIAQESGVEIVSLRPGKIAERSLFMVYYFNIRLRVNTFHKVGEFISMLESNPDIFTVVSVNMEPDISYTNLSQDKKEDMLITDLQIITVLVKDRIDNERSKQ